MLSSMNQFIIPIRSATPDLYECSRLPPELEQEIFELAAWEDAKTAYCLMLVAKRAFVW